MIAVETALRFTAAWLAVGLGLFIATGSLGALRTAAFANGSRTRGARRALALLYVVPFGLAVALLAVGLVAVIRVVPW